MVLYEFMPLRQTDDDVSESAVYHPGSYGLPEGFFVEVSDGRYAFMQGGLSQAIYLCDEDEAEFVLVPLRAEAFKAGGPVDGRVRVAHRDLGDCPACQPKEISPCEFGYSEAEHLRNGVYAGCTNALKLKGDT